MIITDPPPEDDFPDELTTPACSPVRQTTDIDEHTDDWNEEHNDAE